MYWQYKRRVDGLIAVTLDNNVWDFMFKRHMDLRNELPSENFIIFINREVEIESTAIPDIAAKSALKRYIKQTMSM